MTTKQVKTLTDNAARAARFNAPEAKAARVAELARKLAAAWGAR